jgi:hypothetical protein
MVWEWVWRFAARLSRHIRAEYGLPRINPRALSSRLCWPPVVRRLRVLYEKRNPTISRLVCVADADEFIDDLNDVVRLDAIIGNAALSATPSITSNSCGSRAAWHLTSRPLPGSVRTTAKRSVASAVSSSCCASVWTSSPKRSLRVTAASSRRRTPATGIALENPRYRRTHHLLAAQLQALARSLRTFRLRPTSIHQNRLLHHLLPVTSTFLALAPLRGIKLRSRVAAQSRGEIVQCLNSTLLCAMTPCLHLRHELLT